MSDRRPVLSWLVALLVVAPLSALVVRAAADVWRAPQLLPQQWGTRGVRYVVSGSAGAAEAMMNSMLVAGATTALAVVVGWSAARVLGEGRVRHLAPVFLVVAAPLLVPQFATGTGLATWFIRLGLSDTLAGLVLAHLVYVLPYVVLLLAPGFGAEVRRLEEAAATSGAGPMRRVLLVTVPAVRGPLAIAVLLGFIVSLSQYGTSLAVGGGLPMLPLVLAPFVQTDPQIAAALSLAFLVPAAAALVLAVRSGRQVR